MEYWILLYQTWIIVGILFILLELTDGSTIFFLPLGIGSFFISIFIYLLKKGMVPELLILDAWYQILVLWAVISISISIFLARFWNKKSNSNDDVNNY